VKSGYATATAQIRSNLTSLDAFSGTPRWSRDGERIAFDSDVGGKWAIFVVAVAGASLSA
jgi:Tol biopolymer transport system component